MSDLASSLCCRRTCCKATANNVICLPKAPNQMKSKERSPGGRSSRYDDYDRDSRRRRSRSRSYERYRSRSPSYDRRRRRSESPREYVSSLRNISHFYHGLFITFFFFLRSRGRVYGRGRSRSREDDRYRVGVWFDRSFEHSFGL